MASPDSGCDVAAFGLGRIGDPASLPALIGLLKDPGWQVRVHAVWALGRCGNRRGLPPLQALAEDKASGPYRRARAMGSMARIVGAKATRAEAGWMVARLSDKAWEVRAAADAALRAISGKDQGYRYHAPA